MIGKALEINDFDINSGFIFNELSLTSKWKMLDAEFLLETQDFFYSELIRNKIISVKGERAKKKYLLNYETERYPKAFKDAKEPGMFPYPSYVLVKIKPYRYNSIISYDESCLVKRESPNFNVFFALMLYTIDKMKFDDFNDYQLNVNFNSDCIEYNKYIENLFFEYKDRIPLEEKLIYRYIQSNTKKDNNDITIKTNTVSAMSQTSDFDNNDPNAFSARRQVIGIMHILKELDVFDKLTLKEKNKFALFLTGKNLPENHKDSALYGLISNAKKRTSDSYFNIDLEFVASQFDAVKLHKIAKEIRSEKIEVKSKLQN